MYHPLGFRLLLEDYFKGTKPQKRNAFLRLVRALLKDKKAAPVLTDILREFTEEEASEILLRIAERLDIESHNVVWKEENFQNVMLNTIRFYSCAGALIKELRRKRLGKDGCIDSKEDSVSPSSNNFPWSKERIREELIKVFLENRCIRKAAAESLLTTPENLRSRIFPQFQIREKEVKRKWIHNAVRQNHGGVKETARQLGMNIRTLQKKLRAEEFLTHPQRLF